MPSENPKDPIVKEAEKRKASFDNASLKIALYLQQGDNADKLRLYELIVDVQNKKEAELDVNGIFPDLDELRSELLEQKSLDDFALTDAPIITEDGSIQRFLENVFPENYAVKKTITLSNLKLYLEAKAKELIAVLRNPDFLRAFDNLKLADGIRLQAKLISGLNNSLFGRSFLVESSKANFLEFDSEGSPIPAPIFHHHRFQSIAISLTQGVENSQQSLSEEEKLDLLTLLTEIMGHYSSVLSSRELNRHSDSLLAVKAAFAEVLLVIARDKSENQNLPLTLDEYVAERYRLELSFGQTSEIQRILNSDYLLILDAIGSNFAKQLFEKAFDAAGKQVRLDALKLYRSLKYLKVLVKTGQKVSSFGSSFSVRSSVELSEAIFSGLDEFTELNKRKPDSAQLLKKGLTGLKSGHVLKAANHVFATVGLFYSALDSYDAYQNEDEGALVGNFLSIISGGSQLMLVLAAVNPGVWVSGSIFALGLLGVYLSTTQGNASTETWFKYCFFGKNYIDRISFWKDDVSIFGSSRTETAYATLDPDAINFRFFDLNRQIIKFQSVIYPPNITAVDLTDNISGRIRALISLLHPNRTIDVFDRVFRMHNSVDAFGDAYSLLSIKIEPDPHLTGPRMEIRVKFWDVNTKTFFWDNNSTPLRIYPDRTGKTPYPANWGDQRVVFFHHSAGDIILEGRTIIEEYELFLFVQKSAFPILSLDHVELSIMTFPSSDAQSAANLFVDAKAL